MTRYAALLRGVNVGTAKRISMPDLRAVFESLGFTSVRSLLASGNVVFEASGGADAAAIEEAVATATGVRASVVLLTAARLRSIAEANPLLDVASDPSRATITFVDGAPDTLSRPSDEELAPERVAFAAHAVYQWCPDGISKSKLPAKFFASLGPRATARNLRTVNTLLEMLED